ncbi:MAG: glycerophosphodiester phosphodiesterase [Christensenellales bacterium]
MSISICGHRGASGYAPENTLEAFKLAADMGADAVELDVHLTRDGQLLVAHDEKVDRVSNGTGLIADLTLAQIKKLDFNKLHPEYEAAKAPTLGEVYELLQPTGLKINVELKNSINLYPGMEEKCLALAAKMGMESRILYSSFNHYSVLRVKQIDSHAVCGLLFDSILISPWQYARDHGMDALHPHYGQTLFFEDFCQKAHQAGLMVNVWTVNNERDMKRVIEVGCDMLITNYPDRAKALLG